VRQREASTTELYFIGDGDGETVMVQWIAFESTDNGYFGSVPFVAGTLDGASGEEKTWPDGEFTQPPFVFASIATDRTDGDVSVRMTNNTPESTIFTQEGSQTDEKVAYMAYNGKGQGGAVVNAETVHVQTYNWGSSGGWSACSREGLKTRTVECHGSNQVTYESAYCTAFAGGEEPASSAACTADESIFESAGKCLTYSVKSENYELADCNGAAAQRFQMTDKGQIKNAKDGRCVKTGSTGVHSATCAELEDQQWSFDDGKLVSATSDTTCLVVDPASKLNILTGECAPQTWEAKKPVLTAKKYGFMAVKSWGQCLNAAGTTVGREACAYSSGYLAGQLVYKPGQMWTLTVNDELKTDDSDLCLKTTGLLEGDWEDPWSPKSPPFELKLDGDKVISNECDGFLNGLWADPMSPTKHKVCMNNKTGKVKAGVGGASGTWANNKLTMSFGGPKMYTATNDGDKLHWSNGNVWTRDAGSEDVSTATIDGGTLTWPFWVGGTQTATITGDKLIWSNGNAWKRVSAAPLAMATCDGSSSQKWTVESPGDIKAELDFGTTCVSMSDTPGEVTVTKCGTAPYRPWTQGLLPSSPELELTGA
jgi:hypothetical protein